MYVLFFRNFIFTVRIVIAKNPIEIKRNVRGILLLTLLPRLFYVKVSGYLNTLRRILITEIRRHFLLIRIYVSK